RDTPPRRRPPLPLLSRGRRGRLGPHPPHPHAVPRGLPPDRAGRRRGLRCRAERTLRASTPTHPKRSIRPKSRAQPTGAPDPTRTAHPTRAVARSPRQLGGAPVARSGAERGLGRRSLPSEAPRARCRYAPRASPPRALLHPLRQEQVRLVGPLSVPVRPEHQVPPIGAEHRE